MHVTVLLFASYADALGRSTLELDVAPTATVADLLVQVRSLTNGRELPPAVVAINQSYAHMSDRISGGDEIAIIPPVAGG